MTENLIKEDAIKKSRIIYFSGDVDEKSSRELIEKLIQLECEDPVSDIVLYIDSYGGSVYSFLAIHDAMKMSRCDIATVCIGKTMSAGQMILISGTKGKRFITPNATILMHAISSVNCGNIHQLDNEMQESKRLQSVAEDMILKYTKINKKRLKELMSKDSYIDAKTALNLGIVDYIVDHPSVLHSKIKIDRV